MNKRIFTALFTPRAYLAGEGGEEKEGEPTVPEAALSWICRTLMQ